MSLFGRLFVLFVLVPIIELALLVQLGRVVGVLPTVALVLLTGVAGAGLARAEGMRVLFGFQNELAGGRLPEQALFDGICILVGGAVLLTPGILTDLLGFALLVPLTRRWIQKRVRRSLERRMEQGSIRVVTFGGGSGFGGFAGGGFGGGGFEHGSSEERVESPDLDPRHGIEVSSDER